MTERPGPPPGVLVVGGGSMVAKALTARLGGRGLRVATAGRSPSDAIFVDLATGRFQAPAAPSRWDIVVNCAAAFGGDDAEGMRDNIQVNVLGMAALDALAASVGARKIVHVSSISAIEHPENAYFNAYGLTKRQGCEVLSFLCGRRGIPLAVVMPSQIVDIDGLSRRHQPLFWAILDSARAGRDVVLHGTNDPWRDFVLVDDTAATIEDLVLSDADGVHHCLGERPVRLTELANMALTLAGRGGRVVRLADRPDLKTVHVPAAPRRPRVPRTPLEDILKRILAPREEKG